MLTPAQVAEVCHEANRAYCRTRGDTSHASWNACPVFLRNSVIEGVKQHIANPGISPANLHQSWCDYKRAEGWRYGPRKNAKTRTHPNLLPYDELPEEERRKDSLFAAIVRALS